MKTLFLTLSIAIGIVALAGRAEAQNYPWCAVLDTGDASYNCGFVTFEQCLATVRGIGGTCMVNTTYRPVAIPRPRWQNR
ncbi:MAG TPA: DUF3551 domain-containing protein [Xanthobacteraceae bacterium]|jgi:hypothetical protein|nr:DUF3551 domain-containing protein [Xanthobacteraceae bacterium]